MPSHSPYALSNLTVIGSRKLHKNKRVFWNWSFTQNISISEKPLRFCKLSLTGLDILYLFLLISLIYHLFDVTLFSFQGTTFWIWCPFLTIRKNCLFGNPYEHPLDWWRWGESNSWPPACKAGALPAELHPHILSFVLRTIPFHNCVKAPRHTLSIVFVALPCSEKAALSKIPLRAFRFGRFNNPWF